MREEYKGLRRDLIISDTYHHRDRHLKNVFVYVFNWVYKNVVLNE